MVNITKPKKGTLLASYYIKVNLVKVTTRRGAKDQ